MVALALTTDACLTGYGAAWNGECIAGQWDKSDRSEVMRIERVRSLLLRCRPLADHPIATAHPTLINRMYAYLSASLADTTTQSYKIGLRSYCPSATHMVIARMHGLFSGRQCACGFRG